MSLEQWEKKILEAPGAEERVREIEDELRLAAGLTALREKAACRNVSSPSASACPNRASPRSSAPET